MSFGYIRIPRSLLHDEVWKNLSLKQKHIFITIVELACYQTRKFDDHGQILELLPGQLCISERELALKCGKEISRIDVQRSIEKLRKLDFSSHKVIHRKTVITITRLDVYNLFINEGEPISEPKVSQTCAKLEPETNKGKKGKKGKKEQPPMGVGVLEEKISYREFVALTAEEHQKLIAEHGEEKTNRILDKLNSYKGSSGKTYKSDYMAIYSWVLDRINQDEKNGTAKKPNHDAGQNEPAEPKFRSNKVFTFGG